MRLTFQRRTLRLAQPLQTAYGPVPEREIVSVQLSGEDGVTGHGEAAPLEPYDGVSMERTVEALHRYEQVIASFEDSPGDDRGGEGGAQGGPHGARGGTGEQAPNGVMGASRLIDACRSADPLPQALAAIDLALWDRAGRREGRPVCRLLTDRPEPSVAVNATISADDRASAAAEAAAAADLGFRCVKLKVGVGDDAGRVAAVRASVGPDVALRLDANGAWSVEQAVRAIEALSPAGLELVEEPTHGLASVREVRERVAVRVAIDETAAEPGALGAGVADAVCLKISRCGGISGLLAAAALVRASGAEVYLASTLDGPLGIAAAVHAAAALASRGPVAPCGLATLSLFEGLGERLAVRGGAIEVPAAPGLGVGPA